jgi:hypothetical protein
MTDHEHKQIPKVPGGSDGGSEARAADPARSAELQRAPDEKEHFDPFKFQSITMPPGLRAELIE